MSTLRQAAQQALEAWDTRAGIDTASRAFEALRAALAEPVQEPQPLTDEEIDAEWRKAASEEGFTTAQFVRNFARVIERAHGIT